MKDVNQFSSINMYKKSENEPKFNISESEILENSSNFNNNSSSYFLGKDTNIYLMKI